MQAVNHCIKSFNVLHLSLDETAIFEAVKNNKLEIVVTVLKAGAIQFSDIDGVTPAILAARKGFVLIVSFLTKNVVAQEEHDAWKLLGWFRMSDF